MRILHVLDHSLPVQSGYAFRSDSSCASSGRSAGDLAGHESEHGPYTVAAEEIDGLSFFERRHPRRAGAHFTARPVGLVRALRRRVRELVREFSRI